MKLQRENRIPINPRFSYVTEKAYDFLFEYGYNRFPVSPFQVLEALSDFVACLPWSEAKKILKLPEQIEQKKTYKKMFERLYEQHQFAKIQGFSHPELPYDEMEEPEGTVIQRVRYCPTCLNHDFDDDADYRNICGQPLYSRCKSCNISLKINEYFCPQYGEESAITHKHYVIAERRLQNINDCSKHTRYLEDWIQYPYWGYVRMRLSGRNRSTPVDLKTALLYSNAYIDDNDSFIIFTDTVQASALIYKHRDIVLDFVRKTDAVNYKDLEVYVADEI